MKTEIYGIIYKIKNKINNKVYIGQTCQKGGFNKRYPYKGEDIERVYRFHQYQLEIQKNRKNGHKELFNDIKKYGFDNFEVNKQLDIAFSKEELDIKEILWVRYYDSFNNGYNRTIGGEYHGGIGTQDETYRETIRQRLISKSNNIICVTTGEKFVCMQDIVDKYPSTNLTGITSCCYFKYDSCGKLEDGTPLQFVFEKDYYKGIRPKRSKKDVRVYCITTNEFFKDGKTACEYYKLDLGHLYDNCKNKNNYCGNIDGIPLQWMYYYDYINGETKDIITNTSKKKVRCINTGKIFNSIKEASIYYNCDKSSLAKCCKGKRASCGKDKNGNPLTWEYVEERA